MFRGKLRWLVVVVPGVVLTMLACSDDDRPPGAAAGGSSSGGSSGTSSSGGLRDGAAEGGDAEPDEILGPQLCVGVEQASQVMGEWNSNSVAEPASGGAITRGRYVLNEMVVYGYQTPDASDPPPPGPTGNYARATLYVGKNSIRFIESRGTNPDALPADTVRAVGYTASGSTLTFTNVCPTSGGSSTQSYTATANLLTFHTGPNTATIYRLSP